jgi:uncharacterized delta-60 repeat protein
MDGVLVTDTSMFFGWIISQHQSTQQSNGKIIVGGYYLPLIAADVLPQAELARYSVDGVLDGDFGSGGKIHPQPAGTGGSYIAGVYTGPQDEIIAVGGGFDAARGVPSQIFLARYDSNGTPVDGYGTDGVLTVSLWDEMGMDLMPWSSALQNDGTVLVAGMYDTHGGALGSGALLMRLNLEDGTLDPAFGSDGMVLNPEATYAFGQITLQSDGEILVTNSPISSALAIRRFTSTGLPDEGFGTDGVLEIPTLQPQCSALAEGLEGKLYLTAAPSETDFASSDFLLARLNPDGTMDTGFGTDGFVLTDFGGDGDDSCGMLVQADGKIIVGGAAHDAAGGMGPALARYSEEGVLDESFGSGGKVITTGLPGVMLITELAMTPGGKLLATGFTSDGYNFYTTLVRYDMGGGSTDNTPPTITPHIQGTLGLNDWYTSDVTLSWTVEDAESTFWTNGCETVTITADQDDTPYECAAQSAGGLNSVRVYIRRDATAPTLESFVSPDPVVLNGSAIAYLNSYDATSGVDSAGCDPVITSSVGVQTASCTATDFAGNMATVEVTYTVNYNFTGFSQPVDNSGVLNIAKAGQTVPLKFLISDANGNPVTDLTSVNVTTVSMTCSGGTLSDTIEEYATGTSGLQNLGNGYYQWNWKTPTTYANSCKTVRLDLSEGIFHTALFQFRR